MRLFDTAKKIYVEFEPKHLVKIYVCGITPYDSAHLGHIFTFMTYDLLQRRLEDLGHKVQMVRNITDVDEPIYERAGELKTDYMSLANAEISSFRQVLKELNFRSTHAEPRASEYIDEMAEAVKQLMDKGYGYYVDGDIYFDTSKLSEFGKFSGFDQQLQLALMKERGGDPERSGKKAPLDFLLWRNIQDPSDAAQWETVIGKGRPGWHIECSVMSVKLLGNGFDLHGGGTDLIFPHHECEIAQNLGLTNVQPAKHWLHVSPMLLAGEKMSKSLGNMVFARNLLAEHKPATIRLALMHYHHRIGGEWQAELLDEADSLLSKLNNAAEKASKLSAETLLNEVRAALDDDLNTLEVVDALHRFIVANPSGPSPSSDIKRLFDRTLSLVGLD